MTLTAATTSTQDARQRARRAYRERQRAGRMALRIHVDDDAWPLLLVSLGRLRAGEECDKAAVARATIEFIDATTLRSIRNWRG